MNLPTGERAHGKRSARPNCFFANMVTDVVVQAPDEFGHKGGAVLAAVGWRAGSARTSTASPSRRQRPLPVGRAAAQAASQAVDVDTNGFAPQNRIGRVELGAATGAEQNHDYVYAIVQDAELFNRHA